MGEIVNVELELLEIRKRAAGAPSSACERDRQFLLEWIDKAQAAFWAQHKAMTEANASLTKQLFAMAGRPDEPADVLYHVPERDEKTKG
jgi:hypothetical protein